MEKSERLIDILFNGTEEEIKTIKCDCGGKILFNFVPDCNAFKMCCDKCNILISLNGVDRPNCVDIYGNTNAN